MKKLVLTLCMVLFAAPALAKDRAWTIARQVLEHKRDAESFMILYDNGNLVLRSRYSNGRRLAGIHFKTEVIFYSAVGKVLFAGQQGAGLNATHGGKTVVVHVSEKHTLNKNLAAQVDHIKVRFRTYSDTNDPSFFIEWGSKEGWKWPDINFDPVADPLPTGWLNMTSTGVPKPSSMRTHDPINQPYKDFLDEKDVN